MGFLTNRNLRSFLLNELRQNPVSVLSEFVPFLRRPIFSLKSMGLTDILSGLNLEVVQLNESVCSLRKNPYINRLKLPSAVDSFRLMFAEKLPTLSLSEAAQMSELAVKMYWQQYLSEQSHVIELKEYKFEILEAEKLARCMFADVRYSPSQQEREQYLAQLTQPVVEWPLDLPFFDEKGSLIGSAQLTLLVRSKFDALLT